MTPTATQLPPTPTPFLTPAGTPVFGVTPTGTPVFAVTPTGVPTVVATPTATTAPVVTPTGVAPGATVTPTAAPVTEARLEVASKAGIGDYLTDQGRALYIFRSDDMGLSTCYSTCAESWMPVLTRGRPTAGARVDASLVGAVERLDKSMQATYKSWPLYRFKDDAASGDTKAHMFDGVFFLVSPTGDPIGMDPEGLVAASAMPPVTPAPGTTPAP